MESAWPSMPSFKIDTLCPDFLKTHLRGDSPMDTALSGKVPFTVVPYVIYLASRTCIILARRLELMIAYHTSGDQLPSLFVCDLRYSKHQGQRISSSIDIGGAA